MKGCFRFLAAILLLVGLAHAQETEPLLDPSSLAGEHRCVGRNADGSTYEGTVTIRVKKGLVLVQWNIGGQLSYGTGLVEGMGLGVALENGVAIYQVVPQAEGKTLVGLWVKQGEKSATEETIYIGNTDIDRIAFPAQKINGSYAAGKFSVTISGGDTVKKLTYSMDGKSVAAQGLLLGENLAVITPGGLSVYQLVAQGKRFELSGHSVGSSGEITPTTFVP